MREGVGAGESVADLVAVSEVESVSFVSVAGDVLVLVSVGVGAGVMVSDRVAVSESVTVGVGGGVMVTVSVEDGVGGAVIVSDNVMLRVRPVRRPRIRQ